MCKQNRRESDTKLYKPFLLALAAILQLQLAARVAEKVLVDDLG